MNLPSNHLNDVQNTTINENVRILCFTDYYLPGFRAGGPIKTISNFVDQLGDEFEIRIITRDRDVLDSQSYKNVLVDCWNTVGKAQVFYCSRSLMSLNKIAKLLLETPHDVLYLNSFFSVQFTILPLIARKLGLSPKKPCVIAPRGELSSGALAIKTWKKSPYLFVARALALYQDSYWQASSSFEKMDIQETLGELAKQISIAPDLPPLLKKCKLKESRIRPNLQESLKLIYLSRISPMKNLNFLLRVLSQINGPLQLSIYGPLEDSEYWSKCEGLLMELPSRIKVRYLGEVKPENVQKVFGQYDLFVLPTRGENFGHVVLESLSAGTPVLLSDRTSWKPDPEGALEVLPLVESKWGAAIESWARTEDVVLQKRRRAAVAYASSIMDNPLTVQQNRLLFKNILFRFSKK